MNNLMATSPTMTSLEIATLVESQHGNVRTSIERLAEKGVIQLPAMQKVEDKQSLSPNNKTKVYIFSGEQGKRDSIVVVAQLSPEFTARLVDRWQELEAASKKPLSGAEILIQQGYMMLALEQEQARQAQQMEDIKATVSDVLNRTKVTAKTVDDNIKSTKMYIDAMKDTMMYLTVAELARRRKCSVKALNNALDAAGFQKWYQTYSGANCFDLTTLGERFGTKRVKSSGDVELFWSPKVIDFLIENS